MAHGLEALMKRLYYLLIIYPMFIVNSQTLNQTKKVTNVMTPEMIKNLPNTCIAFETVVKLFNAIFKVGYYLMS